MVFCAGCKDDVIGGETPPWQVEGSIRIIVENENGENLLNPNTPNNFIWDQNGMSDDFYLESEDGQVQRLDWREYFENNVIYGVTEPINWFDAFFIRRLNCVSQKWEKWNPELYSDDDYSIVIPYVFGAMAGKLDKEAHVYKLYYGNFKSFKTLRIETPNTPDFLENRAELTTVYVDGVKYASLPVKIRY